MDPIPKCSAFERCPPEIRVKIYRYALSNENCIVNRVSSMASAADIKRFSGIASLEKAAGPLDRPHNDFDAKRCFRFAISLFRVNKSLGNESRAFFYCNNSFARFRCDSREDWVEALDWLPHFKSCSRNAAMPRWMQFIIHEGSSRRARQQRDFDREYGLDIIVVLQDLEMLYSSYILHHVAAELLEVTDKALLAQVRSPSSLSQYPMHGPNPMQALMNSTMNMIIWEVCEGSRAQQGPVVIDLATVIIAAGHLKSFADHLMLAGLWPPAAKIYRKIQVTFMHEEAYLFNSLLSFNGKTEPDGPWIANFFHKELVDCVISLGMLRLALHSWGSVLSVWFPTDRSIHMDRNTGGLHSTLFDRLPPLAKPVDEKEEQAIKTRAAYFWLIASACGKMDVTLHDVLRSTVTGTLPDPVLGS